MAKLEEPLSRPENLMTKQAEEDLVNAVTSEEIAELRKKLDQGYFENYFSSKFWQTLHSNHGSTLGYTFGFLVILFLNHNWMLEEFADATEGHSVAKTFVILFVIYSYSVITLGLELVQLVFLILELYFPLCGKGLRENFDRAIGMLEKLKTLQSSKYFYTPVVVLWCMLIGWIGSILWKWFWWNHICKSYHDRTCRGSWLGQLVIRYRDEACFDGTESSMMCERFVSYLPIMIFSVFFVFVGNVFVPLVNDSLSAYYPMSETLEAAFRIMDGYNNDQEDDTPQPDALPTTKEHYHKNDFDHEVPQTAKQFKRLDEKTILQETAGAKVGILRKVIPTGLCVLILVLLDWMIVKKFFVSY